MISRIFENSPTRKAALNRLGAATVLHWQAIPPALQERIITQALALSDEQIALHQEIARLTKLAGRRDEPPSG
jgi:hypothetical protein